MGSRVRNAWEVPVWTNGREALRNVFVYGSPKAFAAVNSGKEDIQQLSVNDFSGRPTVCLIIAFFFITGGMASEMAAFVRLAAHKEA